MKNVVLTTDRTKWLILTPERRKALYGLFAAIGMVGVAYGGWTAESWEQWSAVAQQVLSVIGLLVATVHTGGAYLAPAYGTVDGGSN